VLKTPEQREQAWIEMLERKAQARTEAKRASARKAMRKRRKPAREVRRVQRYRKKKKAEQKAARPAVLMAEKAARDARRVARQEKHACDLRKHATQRQGFVDGYNTMTPQTKPELKAQSWAKRYREAYAQGRTERQRCDVLLAQQQQAAQTTPSPVTIRLS
jgi:hypothetical protein